MCRGRVVAGARPRGHHLAVVMMRMDVGMQGLGVLRGDMERCLLDWVCLTGDRLWSNATSPNQWRRVRLSCLWTEGVTVDGWHGCAKVTSTVQVVMGGV